MTPPVTPPVRLVVAGAGAPGLRSTVALNVAVAAASAGVATLLDDRHGASSRALARPCDADGVATLPWAAAALHVHQAESPHGAPPGVALVVVDSPPRLDAAVQDELARATVVLVPVDATPVARRALRELAAGVAALEAPPRLHAVLTRSLPRDADRWALLEALDALAPDALLPTTLPAGRPGTDGAARLYAPGTRASAAYAAVYAALAASLAVSAAPPATDRLTSTTP